MNFRTLFALEIFLHFPKTKITNLSDNIFKISLKKYRCPSILDIIIFIWSILLLVEGYQEHSQTYGTAGYYYRRTRMAFTTWGGNCPFPCPPEVTPLWGKLQNKCRTNSRGDWNLTYTLSIVKESNIIQIFIEKKTICNATQEARLWRLRSPPIRAAAWRWAIWPSEYRGQRFELASFAPAQ